MNNRSTDGATGCSSPDGEHRAAAEPGRGAHRPGAPTSVREPGEPPTHQRGAHQHVDRHPGAAADGAQSRDRGDLPGLLVGQVAQPHKDQHESGLEHPRIDLAPPRDAVQEHGIDAPVTNDRTEPVPTLDQTGADAVLLHSVAWRREIYPRMFETALALI